jgi:hypothetical protein
VQAQLISLQAAREMLAGSYEMALELIDRARVLTQRTQLYTQTRTDLLMRAFVWIDQGCLPERLAELAPAVPSAIADRLRPYAAQLAIHGGIGALGPVAVPLGMAEAAAGRTDEAERHLKDGIGVAERHGFLPALARGRLALAQLLAAPGRAAGCGRRGGRGPGRRGRRGHGAGRPASPPPRPRVALGQLSMAAPPAPRSPAPRSPAPDQPWAVAPGTRSVVHVACVCEGSSWSSQIRLPSRSSTPTGASRVIPARRRGGSGSR